MTRRKADKGPASKTASRQYIQPRKWHVPPALLYDPAERLEGERVLCESNGDLGLVLWRTVRDVALWAATPPESRDQLFAVGSDALRLARLTAAGLPDAIARPVDTLNSMLMLGGNADADTVMICCLEIAAWARTSARPHTALAFAQAGALASPAFSEAALHTGICAAEAGQAVRAGTWLRRALALARQEKNLAAYTVALSELGSVYEGLAGGIPRAERYDRKAYKAGKRFTLPDARLQALYGLRRIALARGDTAKAERLVGAIGRHERRWRPDRSGRGPDPACPP
ncbi:MAG TPA: hypothetical protein VF665_18010 [Longimicrobium sp.]|jgi:hypothetical protein|uniref:hypothetical protein n=1 Tax=Longimicrobium sp. TaxID=2029185 RepID=UPI002ED7808A